MRHSHPALRWLIKHDPEAALLVFHRLRDAYYTYGTENPTSTSTSPDDAQTIAPPDSYVSSETMAEATDGPDELATEFLHEVTPDLHEMLRSAGGIAWPWCGARVKQSGRWRWVGEPWAYEFSDCQGALDGHVLRLGGLTFHARSGWKAKPESGLMISYVDKHGKLSQPGLSAKKPRGGKQPRRSDPVAYLALSAPVPSPLEAKSLQRPLSGERVMSHCYDPLPAVLPSENDKVGRFGVEEARAVLKFLGVDGSVPFERLAVKATKLPTAVARGARFVGGISGAKATSSMPAPIWQQPEAEILSPVLEEVAARGTLESIGIRLGYCGGYADRAGKRALLAAGRELVAANENNRLRRAA